MGTHKRNAELGRCLRDVLDESEIFGPRRPGDRGAALHASDRARLVRAARTVAREAGEVLWTWGDEGEGADPGDGIGVVLRGALDIQRSGHDGPDVVLRRLDPGDEVGFSTIAGEPHTADLVAVGATTAAILPRAAIVPLLAKRTGFTLRIFAHMGHLVGLLTDEKLAWRTQSLDDRVHTWILAHVPRGAEIPVRHEDIARFVGATRPRVSNALKRLERRKVVCLRQRGHLRRP